MRTANRALMLLMAALCVAACDPVGSGNGHQSFVISGSLSPGLAPGRAADPLDLTLRNPNNQQLAIGDLTVTVQGTSAGRACDAGNFGVTQYRGGYPLVLGARQTASLTQLGVPAAALPHVGMIDRPSNQDGCKHVTVYLTYTGVGAGR